MGIRSDIFTNIKAALVAASLTASDASSSSLPVTLTGEYPTNKSKQVFPMVVISKADLPSTGTIAFGDGFLSEREPRVTLDIYAKRMIKNLKLHNQE